MHDLSELFKAPETIALKESGVLKQSLNVQFRTNTPPTCPNTNMLMPFIRYGLEKKIDILAF